MPLDTTGKLTAPQPPDPVRQFSFTDFQVNNPTAPPPGDRLDSEFDQTNASVSATLTWAAVSLNTDGTLRDGSVGNSQLVPGLFDTIADDAVSQVQPLVDEAQTYASSALTSADTAATAASQAGASAVQAANAATSATGSVTAAGGSANTALVSANNAQTSAAAAANSANHADGDAALCADYGVVTQAWAEHMPDTIPPNILAVMAVTGDHWSSRWWANQTNLYGEAIIGAIQGFYLGAFMAPPLTDSQGKPVKTGALYYNIALGAMYVWTGNSWQPAMGPGPTQTVRFVYLATAGQTVFTGPDRDGHALALDPAGGQTVAVWENGLLRTPVTDYVAALNTITLHTPCAAGDIVQVAVETTPGIEVTHVAASTVGLKTASWVFNGVTTVFPLTDPSGTAVTPTAASDVLISLDGVWQQANTDYTVAGSNLTFLAAPSSDARAFGVVIVPVLT